MFSTSRLKIFEWTEELAEELFHLTQDSGFNLYLIGQYKQNNIDSAKSWIQEMRKITQSAGFGKWAVSCRETGEIIGLGGLTSWQHQGQTYVDITYRLRTSFWGKGFGIELATGLCDYAFHKLRLTEITATVDPDNLPSKKILEKLGMKFKESLLLYGVPTDLYLLDKEHYLNSGKVQKGGTESMILSAIPSDFANFLNLQSQESKISQSEIYSSISFFPHHESTGSLLVLVNYYHYAGVDHLTSFILRGIKGIVIEKRNFQKIKDTPETETLNIYVVESMSQFLWELLSFRREQMKNIFITIVGSSGKTQLNHILAIEGSPLASIESNIRHHNNILGLIEFLFSSNLQNISPSTAIILEVGGKHPGELLKIHQALRPKMSLLTSIHSTHSASLGSFEKTFAFKTEFFNLPELEGILMPKALRELMLQRLNSQTLAKIHFVEDFEFKRSGLLGAHRFTLLSLARQVLVELGGNPKLVTEVLEQTKVTSPHGLKLRRDRQIRTNIVDARVSSWESLKNFLVTLERFSNENRSSHGTENLPETSQAIHFIYLDGPPDDSPLQKTHFSELEICLKKFPHSLILLSPRLQRQMAEAMDSAPSSLESPELIEQINEAPSKAVYAIQTFFNSPLHQKLIEAKILE